MPFIEVDSEKDEKVLISYADYGEGAPVVLIHGWPLSHRMWEKQILALTQNGYRVIAYDRRGFGESYKPWGGYDYDTLTRDLAKLLDKLDLRRVTLVGFSMGAGEVVRYIAQHNKDRIAKAVLISAVTPFLKQTDDNPDGVKAEVFEGMLEGIQTDRPAFLEEFTKQFVNWHTIGKNDISQASLNYSWDMGVWASPKATMACVESFSSTDFRTDLLALADIPTLLIHGDSDNVVPFEASTQRTHAALPNATLQVVEGGPHGLPLTHPEIVNEVLLNFLKA